MAGDFVVAIGSNIASVLNSGRDDEGHPAGDFLNTLEALKEQGFLIVKGVCYRGGDAKEGCGGKSVRKRGNRWKERG